ncbi:MAG: restriction endonuclease, partial [Chloroflexaceae bacterium]|nr:restriction endonuclease [Chloroflexaceae bacterium]
MREQLELRGGRLERHTPVRTLEDVQGLSLPQLGTYVSDMFKKNGFALSI